MPVTLLIKANISKICATTILKKKKKKKFCYYQLGTQV